MKRSNGREHLLLAGIITGAAAGLLVGWVSPEAGASVDFIGQIFIRMLQMLVVPLIVASMVTGVASLGDIRKLGGVGGISIAYYMATTCLALLLGLLLVNLMEPGVGMDISNAELSNDMAGKDTGWRDLVVSLFTPNLFRSAARTDILPLIIFSGAFGAVLTTLNDETAKPITRVFESLNAAIMKLVGWVMWIAPVGVFGLVAGRLAAAGGGEQFVAVLVGLGLFALTVVVGILIHAGVTIPLFALLVGGKNPLRHFAQMGTALATAVSTSSSSATLPVTTDCAIKAGISEKNAGFILPLGATVNMDGTALYEAIAALFIAQAWGIELTAGQQVVIFLTAMMASVGAAGIPEAGMVTMILVLNSVGLPIEGIGLLLSIDWFLDRLRTAANVWGDTVGAVVLQRVAGP